MPQLMRERLELPHPVVFDDSQRAVLEATASHVRVLGAPGTGKTTLAIEIVAQAVAAGTRPDACVLLSPTRVGAGALRSAATARIGGTSSEPIARTPQALAFGILRAQASFAGDPAPRLLTGPEQDVVLKELLAGHAAGFGRQPQWPHDLTEALGTRGFRNELRDLLMRAVEWGVSPQRLAELGRKRGRGDWVAAATMLSEYEDVTALSSPGAFDPASILGAAAAALRADAQLLARYQSQLALVVVDDAQELTRAGYEFLTVLIGPQTRAVLLGDPDVTVQGFRGADPQFMGELGEAIGAGEPLLLTHGYRLRGQLEGVREAVTQRIGAVGPVAHRQLAAAPSAWGDAGAVRVALLRSAAQEAAHIAGYLRRAHLLGNVAWRDMAVIVRGSGGSAALRRALNAARVPVAVPPSSLALRDEPAVRPFLEALDVVTSPPDEDGEISVGFDTAMNLLTSPLGNADPITLRRMRRALRLEELDAGGSRTSEELMSACLTETRLQVALGRAGVPARRVADVLRAGWAALEAPNADAEQVLWAMWQASGLASGWEKTAFAGGVAGTRADRDLDAILALFSAAGTFVDRVPGAHPRDFLDSIRQQDVPGDRLVAAAPDDDAVALLTPAAAAGREWHTVVVAGVQEGVWPDLRLRGSILGSSELVDVLSGRGDDLRARTAAVRYDETRQFLVAISRARGQLLVTAVRDETEQPSQYLDVVDPAGARQDDEGRPFSEVARPMTLAGVVAEARRMVASADDEVREEGARRLAWLAHEQVEGADPSQWWALVSRSDDRPLRAPDDVVRVSPSKVDSFHTCGLRWLLSNSGGYGPSIGASTKGLLVHELAEEFAELPSGPRLTAMRHALEERWPRMGLGNSWVSKQEYQSVTTMIQRLDAYFSASEEDGWQTRAAEQGFSATVGRAKISGIVDRLEVHPERGLRIIDYKTSASAPTEDEVKAHPQLAVYQVVSLNGAFGAGKNGGAALVQLGDGAGKTPKPKVQEQAALRADEPPSADEAASDLEASTTDGSPAVGSQAWAFDLIAQTADGMAHDSFTATLNDQCTICSVRSSCPLQPEGRTLT